VRVVACRNVTGVARGSSLRQVLSVITAVLVRLREEAVPHVPRILESVFQYTLAMITTNFQDFPEHRLQLYKLLHAMIQNTFVPPAYSMDPASLKVVVDTVVWGFKHPQREVAETVRARLCSIYLGRVCACVLEAVVSQKL
jgi:exportin-1